MKRTFCIILIMVSALVGCKEGTPAATDIKASPDDSIQNENKMLHNQVDQLQAKLQSTEQKYKELQKEVDSTQFAEQSVTTKYPKLADFTTPQTFQKIEIKDAKGSRNITDPAILQDVSNLIVIKNDLSLGSGPQADIEPVQYILTTAKGTVKVNIVQLGIVSFEDLYPGQYFEVDNAAYQFGKAFMNRPSYLSRESSEAKMVNSGLLKVAEKIEDKNVYYVYIAGRIRSVTMVFIHADKHETTKPNNSPRGILNITFYYYSEQIQMNLYQGKAQIIDDTGEKWFDMKDEDIGQIRSALSAG